MQRFTAWSRSASGSTIAAAFPPSSSATRFIGARSRNDQPTRADPVNVSMRMRGSSISGAATSLVQGSTETIPAGHPAS